MVIFYNYELSSKSKLFSIKSISFSSELESLTKVVNTHSTISSLLQHYTFKSLHISHNSLVLREIISCKSYSISLGNKIHLYLRTLVFSAKRPLCNRRKDLHSYLIHLPVSLLLTLLVFEL